MQMHSPKHASPSGVRLLPASALSQVLREGPLQLVQLQAAAAPVVVQAVHGVDAQGPVAELRLPRRRGHGVAQQQEVAQGVLPRSWRDLEKSPKQLPLDTASGQVLDAVLACSASEAARGKPLEPPACAPTVQLQTDARGQDARLALRCHCRQGTLSPCQTSPG
ncbi:unnamed protein product [Prorocentrum cordatum]|uniref:Uncharacterized protein n=1 Tax=Prorocentrum cordatum TaxID=2364126 RepID=A0ABN9VCS5_9DINO|nr:unnamed protein product [Polarella glacialis]